MRWGTDGETEGEMRQTGETEKDTETEREQEAENRDPETEKMC